MNKDGTTNIPNELKDKNVTYGDLDIILTRLLDTTIKQSSELSCEYTEKVITSTVDIIKAQITALLYTMQALNMNYDVIKIYKDFCNKELEKLKGKEE